MAYEAPYNYHEPSRARYPTQAPQVPQATLKFNPEASGSAPYNASIPAQARAQPTYDTDLQADRRRALRSQQSNQPRYDNKLPVGYQEERGQGGSYVAPGFNSRVGDGGHRIRNDERNQFSQINHQYQSSKGREHIQHSDSNLPQRPMNARIGGGPDNNHYQRRKPPQRAFSDDHLSHPESRGGQQSQFLPTEDNGQYIIRTQHDPSWSKPRFVDDQQPFRVSDSARGTKAKASKPKDRIRAEEEPDTLAWDNPFPTFPTGRKKGKDHHNEAVSEGVANLDLNHHPMEKIKHHERPQTADGIERFIPPRIPPQEIVTNGLRNHDAGRPSGSSGYHSSAEQHPSDQYQQDERGAQHEGDDQYQRSGTYNESAANSYADSLSTKQSRSIPPHTHSGYRPVLSDSVSSGRSRTMPNKVSEAMKDGQYHAPYTQSSSTGSPGIGDQHRYLHDTPPSQQRYMKPHLDPDIRPASAEPIPQSAKYPPPVPQDSYGDFFDSYYSPSNQGSHQQPQHRQNARNRTLEEDMPNFDAVSDCDTKGAPLHLQTQDTMLETHSHSSQSPTHQYSPRSRSQPNLKYQKPPYQSIGRGQGFRQDAQSPSGAHPKGRLQPEGRTAGQFNDRQQPRQLERSNPIPLYQSNASTSSSLSNGYTSSTGMPPPSGWPKPQQVRSARGIRSDDAQRLPQEMVLSSNGAVGPDSFPSTPQQNPDALPHHATPLHLGLQQGSRPQQVTKPPPIRQYNNDSLAVQQPAVSSTPPQQRGDSSLPVTQAEIDQLRQDITRNSSDDSSQLVLAKKLVEASNCLVDDRTDPKTRARTREKYIFEAHKIVKKLVNNRYTEAMFYLADCYGSGMLGLETDPKEAFNLYQSAAKAGHAQAAYRVAVCCEIGQEEGGGTRKDPTKAIQWYKRAATLGDTPAMYKIGTIQLKGLLGQARNPKEAIVWLKRAAERADVDNPHALHELVSAGECLET